MQDMLMELGLDVPLDDVPELIEVFCRHKRLIRILLTLCED